MLRQGMPYLSKTTLPLKTKKNMSNKIVKHEDLKDLIAKASELSEQEKKRLANQYTLAEVKKIAWEYDIDASHLEKAYKSMADRKENIRLISYALICLVLVGSVATYAIWPRPFKGSIEMTLTSNLSASQQEPIDQLSKLELYRHNRCYAYFDIFNMDYKHDFRFELRDPNGHIKEQKSREFYTEGDTPDHAEVIVPINIPIGAEVGTWQINVFMDDELKLQRSVPVSYGDVEMSFSSDVYGNGKPVSTKVIFNSSEDEYIEAYIFWPLLSGAHLLEWKWFDENNTVYKHHSLQLSPTGTDHYWAGHRMYTADLPKGRSRVEFYLASTKIGEKEFMLE